MKLFLVFNVFLIIFPLFTLSLDDATCKISTDEVFYNYTPELKLIFSCHFDKNTAVSNPNSKINQDRNEKVSELIGEFYDGSDHFKYIPADIVDAFPNLIKIDIDGSPIEAISKKSFHGLRKLEILELFSNQISRIDEDTFDDLENLQNLSLSGNKLTSLPSKVFAKCTKIKTISLWMNKLTSLDANIFKNNHELEKLTLNNNKLATLAPEIFLSQVNLLEIYIDGNDFTSLNSEWFKTCTKLNALDVGYNKFTEIPLNFTSNLPSLVSFSCEFNPITFVDFAMFDGNKDIVSISFNHNEFTRILNIDFVDQMQKLENLNFQYSIRSCIDGKFGPKGKYGIVELKESVKANCLTE